MSDLGGPQDHEGRVIDFGRVAADYERYRPGFPESFFEALAQRRWIVEGSRCLDLGTGTGTVAAGLARRGLEVVGLDLSAELLAMARDRVDGEGLRVRFVQGRAEELPFSDRSFDVVTAGQCWWWFDEERTIGEVQRVLEPNGRLVLASFSYLATPGTIGARTEALILAYNPGWPKAGDIGIELSQVALLDRLAFEHVETFSYVERVRFDHEGWRGRIRTCNGVGAALAPEVVERFDRDLAALLTREFPEELVVPHRVHVVSGLNPSAQPHRTPLTP